MNIFVIMPFSDDFNFIYSDLIKSTCEDAGFDVQRADDLYSTRSILGDIVISLNSSDLIIADLTDNNPNVLYELGIAHALNKPVQIITQSIDDLPFDMQGYRVFPYSPLAAQYIKDKERFGEIIIEFKNSEMTLFGNPISDFLNAETPIFRNSGQDYQETQKNGHIEPMHLENNKGYFDHLAEFQSTSSEINSRLNTITQATKEIGDNFDDNTTKIKQLQTNPGQKDKITIARRLLIDLSKKLADYSKDIESFNNYFDSKLFQLQDNIELIINYQNNQELSDDEKSESIKTFNKAITSTDFAVEQTNRFADILTQFPNLQGEFTKQSRRVALALHKLTNNFQQMKAVYIRLRDSVS